MIDFESFLFSEPQKKPWSAFRAFRFLLFAFRAFRFLLFAFRFSRFSRARARKQMHMYTLRERERELKTKNQKDKFSQTSERLRERTLPRCRDLSLDKVVRRRLKSILKSIDQSIHRQNRKQCPTAMLL